MLEEFLNSGVDKKLSLKSLMLFVEYLGKDLVYLEKNWKKIKRKDIHCVLGGECYRTWLDKRLKNNSQKNTMVLQLERFFDFMILEYASVSGEFLDNPVIKKWDKFSDKVKNGTVRKVLDISVIRELREILIKNDFSFVKGLGEDFIDGEFNPSRVIMMYLLLTFPLRSMQVRCLDSGLGDGEIYDFESREMIKGTGKRKEGVVQKIYYSGIDKEKKECIFINTNKSGKGFYIPWVNQELLSVLETQRNWVSHFKIVVEKGYGIKDSKKIYPLFLNNKGGVVSRESLMKLWKKLCLAYYEKFGVLIDCDLHTLRVSLVSHGMTVVGDEGKIGNSYSGQTKDVVLHYYREDNLRLLVQEKENNKSLLLGGSNGKI